MKQYQDRTWLEQKYCIEELSCTEISKILNVSPALVSHFKRKFNLKRMIKIYDCPLYLYVKTWIENYSISEIADMNKVSRKPIFNRLKKFKIKAHGVGFYSRKKDEALKNRDITKASLRIKELNKTQKGENHPCYGKRQSENTKKKTSKTWFKKGHIPWNKDKPFMVGKENPFWGKKHTEETKQKILKGILKETAKRPTHPEKVFDEMTPDSIRYTGNRAWWRKLDDGKHHNPDFKITGQNKVIEVFGDYWHKGEDPQELIDLYAQAGLECLVFWEREIYDNPEQIIEKTNIFIEGGLQ